MEFFEGISKKLFPVQEPDVSGVPIKIHSLEKIRKSMYWPKHLFSKEPSVPNEGPYCPEAENDWIALARSITDDPKSAKEHIVRIDTIPICMSVSDKNTGYRQTQWEGPILIKHNFHNETGLVQDPKTKFWYITTGVVRDDETKDMFVVLARFAGIPREIDSVLTDVMRAGSVGAEFSLAQNFTISGTDHHIRQSPL